MIYRIDLKTTAEQPTLTMREVNPVEKLPEFFGKAFRGVMNYLQEIGKQPGGMPFGAYFNFDMEALDVEAGFPVTEVIEGKGEISSSMIPAGDYLCTIHEGPYDKMGPAYDALNQWAQENGYKPTGIVYEYYLNDPSESDDIIALTEIRMPAKKIQP